jgi:hypothetical protein
MCSPNELSADQGSGPDPGKYLYVLVQTCRPNDRYNQLAREQSRVPHAGAISLEQLEQRISVGGRDLQPD